jgi:DNA-binding NarL/FixJ family response regulator
VFQAGTDSRRTYDPTPPGGSQFVRSVQKGATIKKQIRPRPIKVSVVSGRPIVWNEIVGCLNQANWPRPTGPFTAAVAPQRLAAIRPDVVLLDCGSAQRPALDLMRRIRQRLSAVWAVLIVDSASRSVLADATEMGVTALLLRPFTAQELVAAVRVAADEGVYLTPDLARFLLDEFTQTPVGQRTSAKLLTAREREILSLQADGLRYREIAARLHLSRHTVSNHLYAIRQKLGVHRAIEAINRVYRRSDQP